MEKFEQNGHKNAIGQAFIFLSHFHCSYERKEDFMTTTSHLNALERRHASLDEQIHQEMQRPALDELKIGMLKRRKLELKDEMSRLQAQTRQ